MHHRLLFLFVAISLFAVVSCKSIYRDKRDIHDVVPVMSKMAANNRQIGGGLSALGTLVSPLLFLMGMGSFISMLPQMFQTVLSGVGSNLIQSFTGNAGSASPSFRLKRSAGGPLVSDELLNEIERRFNLAVMKYERPIN